MKDNERKIHTNCLNRVCFTTVNDPHLTVKKKTNKNINMSLLFFILLSYQGEEYKRSW